MREGEAEKEDEEILSGGWGSVLCVQESIHGCGGSRGGWMVGDILGGPQINRGGASLSDESVEDALDADLFIAAPTIVHM